MLIAVLAVSLFAPPAPARAAGMTVIRDVEIETYLQDLARPVFLAAGLNPASVRMVIVRDSTLNAYVAGGMNIFLHTALLRSTDDAEQLLGVIAHETGHIAGGHLTRGTAAMKNASLQAILSMVLGVGAAIASGNPNAGAAVITGGQQIAQRSILSFSRAQEGAADAAGMSFLDRTRMTSRGLKEFLEKLGNQELLPVDRQVEYARTHPLTQDRINTVRRHVERSPWAKARLPKAMKERHARMKAKLLGYLQPDAALLRYGEKDSRVNARYARAIALYRKSDMQKALSLLDGLLAEEPDNPWFLELKGQILFESGRVREAIAPYRRVVELVPKAGLLQAAYGHVLLETHDPALVDEAILYLEQSLKTEPHVPATWRFLATAWGEKNEKGLVAYGLAEEALAKAENVTARRLAARAIKLLPKGSPYILRAQDVIKQARENEDDR